MSAIGPPSIASGEMCPMHAPRLAPLNRPSVIKATFRPMPVMTAVGLSISRIPGPPFGPS